MTIERQATSGPEFMSRRRFLGILGAAGFGGALGLLRQTHKEFYDPTFKIYFDKENSKLGLVEAAQMAIRFDRLYDTLPKYKSPATQEDLLAWAVEMIPMFEYEGIVSRSRWPAKEGVDFFLFPDGDSHNHVAGRSDCANYAALNLRFANPHSKWYQDEDAPFTLLHELSHVQQGQNICSTADRDLVENSAQVAALEVAAALVNQGNKELLVPLVSELRGMAISATWAMAIRENQTDAFVWLRSQLSPGAFADARFAKSRRRWSENPEELMEMLDRYNVTPLLMISNAIRFNNAEIEGLAFPPKYADNWYYYIQNPKPLPITLNDTAYFLANAESLVGEAAKTK